MLGCSKQVNSSDRRARITSLLRTPMWSNIRNFSWDNNVRGRPDIAAKIIDKVNRHLVSVGCGLCRCEGADAFLRLACIARP